MPTAFCPLSPVCLAIEVMKPVGEGLIVEETVACTVCGE
jgi:hypothetical protein